MSRSAFLKYYWQVKIGRMDGIFVAYHNTAQIFGFEYLKKKEMTTVVFGNEDLASRSFEVTSQLWQMILNRLTTAYPDKALKVVMQTDRLTKEMDIFVEPMEFDSGWLEPGTVVSQSELLLQQQQQQDPNGGGQEESSDAVLDRRWSSSSLPLPPSLYWYKLRVLTYVNGNVSKELKHSEGDQLDVFYAFDEVKSGSDRDMIRCYRSMLANSKLYVDESDVEAAKRIKLQ